MPHRPWFALNPGDYLRDTQALSLEEHGAYIRLLCHAWNHDGEIPKDARRLGNILGVHTNKAKSLWGFVCGFWYETPTGFRQKRMDREIAYAAEISEKRAEAGRLGGQASAEAKALANGVASYNPQVLSDLLNTEDPREFSLSGEPDPPPAKSNGSRPPPVRVKRADVAEAVADLNRRTRRTFRSHHPDGRPTSAGKLAEHLFRHGYTLADFYVVHARKCREWIDDPKMSTCLRPSTLWRPSNFVDYRGMSEQQESSE